MKWREKWSEKCSEISSRAGGIPQTPFFHQGDALTYKSARHSKAMLCTGGYPQTPSEGQPSDFSINPNPFFIRRGFEPLPKPLANPWQGDVIDYGQKPPFVKGFLYGSQSLCPFGASHGLLHPRFRRPLERGSERERERRQTPQNPMRKRAQRERRQNAAKASNGKRLNEPTTLDAGR